MDILRVQVRYDINYRVPRRRVNTISRGEVYTVAAAWCPSRFGRTRRAVGNSARTCETMRYIINFLN